jgi:hypothetical protein
MQRGLGGAVDRREHLRNIGAAGSDVGDQGRPTMRQHMRDQQVVEMDRAGQQDVDLRLPLRPGRVVFRKRNAPLDAGIVDDEVETRQVPADMLGQRL